MRILVTGANGYIGEGVVARLASTNHTIIATDIMKMSKEQFDNVKYIPANLFELDEPYSYFEKPEMVIHLAWRDGFKHDSINHINELPKHYDFIKKMVDGGVDKVCVMGSMHEVGFYEGCIKEDTPCNPQSLYGIAKNALRESVELLCKGQDVKFIWLRGYYIVGNSESGCSIFSKITQAEKNCESSFPFTTGQNQYDFIDYDKFCSLVVQASLQDKVMGVIECCSGQPEKLADRVERFISDNGYKINLAYGTFPDRAYDSKAVWGSSEKIRLIERNKNE